MTKRCFVTSGVVFFSQLLLLTGCERPASEPSTIVPELLVRLTTIEVKVAALESRSAKRPSYDLKLRPVTLGLTGAEVCDLHGESCIAVKSTSLEDEAGRFCGHAAVGCEDRLVRSPGCLRGKDGRVWNYSFPTATVRRASSPEKGAYCGAGGFCVEGDSDATVAYDAAICIRNQVVGSVY